MKQLKEDAEIKKEKEIKDNIFDSLEFSRVVKGSKLILLDLNHSRLKPLRLKKNDVIKITIDVIYRSKE